MNVHKDTKVYQIVNGKRELVWNGPIVQAGMDFAALKVMEDDYLKIEGRTYDIVFD